LDSSVLPSSLFREQSLYDPVGDGLDVGLDRGWQLAAVRYAASSAPWRARRVCSVALVHSMTENGPVLGSANRETVLPAFPLALRSSAPPIIAHRAAAITGARSRNLGLQRGF
jgi:hypothetical protein